MVYIVNTLWNYNEMYVMRDQVFENWNVLELQIYGHDVQWLYL